VLGSLLIVTRYLIKTTYRRKDLFWFTFQGQLDPPGLEVKQNIIAVGACGGAGCLHHGSQEAERKIGSGQVKDTLHYF
jgi:hypothetical protein